MDKKNKSISKFELLEPFFKEARDMHNRARNTAEWVMKFSTTFIGLILAGSAFINNFTNFSSTCADNYIILSAMISFAISILSALIFWKIIKKKLSLPKITNRENLYNKATAQETKIAHNMHVNNYERIIKRMNRYYFFLNGSIWFLFIGILITLVITFKLVW